MTHGCATAGIVGKPYGITVWAVFGGTLVTHACVTEWVLIALNPLCSKGLVEPRGGPADGFAVFQRSPFIVLDRHRIIVVGHAATVSRRFS